MNGPIIFSTGSDFKKTRKFLESVTNRNIIYSVLDQYGKKGVDILMNATPKRTGATALSWTYRIVMDEKSVGLEWLNSNMANDGVTPVAILIQMGHGTRNGGYVQPYDYINPSMAPLFDEVTEAISRVVKSL